MAVMNNAEGQSLPYSLESEKVVLSCLFRDPYCIENEGKSGFGAERFYRSEHRAIYESLLELRSKSGKADPLLVLEDLKHKKIFDEAAGRQYLLQLSEYTEYAGNLREHLNILENNYRLRSLMNISREILNEAAGGGTDSDALLEKAEQDIYNIRKGEYSNAPRKISGIIQNEVMQRLNQLNSEDREDYLGINTGFDKLDSMIAGLNKADLIVVGGRPGMGKTSFALNVARNVALISRRKVFYFSFEMTNEQLAAHVLATEGRVELIKLRTGKLNPEDWVNISEAASVLQDIQLYFDDTSNITVEGIKAKVRSAGDVDCVVVDYLQQMTPSIRSSSRVQEVAEITRQLKLMAMDLKIPVIALSQLNRDREKMKAHEPQLSDLRESGSIEQDADIVLLLHNREYYGEDEESDDLRINTMKLIVAKNRHGPMGSVNLAWEKKYTLFTTIEDEFDEF